MALESNCGQGGNLASWAKQFFFGWHDISAIEIDGYDEPKSGDDIFLEPLTYRILLLIFEEKIPKIRDS